MMNYQFEKNARRNRHLALFFAITFHVLLLAGLFMGNDLQWESYVPDVVQEWLGDEDAPEEVVAIRP